MDGWMAGELEQTYGACRVQMWGPSRAASVQTARAVRISAMSARSCRSRISAIGGFGISTRPRVQYLLSLSHSKSAAGSDKDAEDIQGPFSNDPRSGLNPATTDSDS